MTQPQKTQLERTQIASKDGTQLYYKQWGEGRPVILISGWPLSADSWDDVALNLAENGFKAIAYDRRGFGRSEQPWTGYHYDTLADDLAAVIEQTGATDATLIGFSMGGGEVARYLSRYGADNIAQAVLISSVVPYLLKTDDNPDGVPQAQFDDMAAQMKADRPEFFKSFFKDFYGIGVFSHPASQGMVDWSVKIALDASLKATLDCAKAFSSTDFRPDLAAFNVPTLLIHGTADSTVPIEPTAEAAAKAIPHAQLIRYEGAPHGLFATHKQQLIDDILDFVKQG